MQKLHTRWPGDHLQGQCTMSHLNELFWVYIILAVAEIPCNILYINMRNQHNKLL